jgi:hypothetical protein
MQDFVDEAMEFEPKIRYAARVERFAEYLKANADATAMAKKAKQKERKRAKKQQQQEQDDDDDEDQDEEEDEEEQEEEEQEDDEKDVRQSRGSPEEEDDDCAVMETLINESLERLQLNTGGSAFAYNNKTTLNIKREQEQDSGGGPCAQLAKACRLGQLHNAEWILEHYSREALVPGFATVWDAVKDLPDTNPIKRTIVKWEKKK